MQQRPVIWLKISGVCGILAPLVAFTSVSLSILSAPQFTLTNNALSNLGIIPGATSAIFNYGLITSGILGLIFSASIYRAVHFYEIHSAIGKSRLINRALGGVLFFPGACFALIAIGIFPQTNSLHNIAADLCFRQLYCRFLACKPEAFGMVHVYLKRDICCSVVAFVSSLCFGASSSRAYFCSCY